jgi:hypothetical protein
MSFELDNQSYDIEDELKVRKILEENTNWTFEFTKNSKYAPDLQLHDWGDEPSEPADRNLTGFVEIERTSEESDWQTGDIPDNWNTVNFLKRKVLQWDRQNEEWGGLKPGFGQTVYLKFNHRFDNCFAASLERILHDGTEYTHRGGGKNWEFYRLHPDHGSVSYGIHDCVKFIEDYLTRVEQEQMTLTTSVSGGQSD